MDEKVEELIVMLDRIEAYHKAKLKAEFEEFTK